MYATQANTHNTKQAASPAKPAATPAPHHGAGERLPAWAAAWDNRPPAALFGPSLSLQAKLTVNTPGDEHEQEADRVAEQVMRMPDPIAAPGLRRCACGGVAGPDGECAACRAKRLGLQRRAAAGSAPIIAPASVHQALQAAGRPLDAATRAFMEPRFGQDFGAVRIHTDARAAASAQAVSALAYTVGRDIVFGPGQYAPETGAGRRLLAHELTHVVQQEAAPSLAPGAAGHSAPLVSRPAPRARQAVQRAVSPRMPRIRDDLSTGWFNSVSHEEAHEVLTILQALSDADLRDTVAAMNGEGLVDRFLDNLSEADQQVHRTFLRRVANYRVWTATTPTGTTSVTGSCSLQQYPQIYTAAQTSVAWLNRAVARLDAYLATPADPNMAPVGIAIHLHFKSVATDVVRHVRGRLDHIRTDIQNATPFAVECHGAWDHTCREAAAYIPGGDLARAVFCPSFFGGASAAEGQAETIVHEMAHAQVGGLHITDRGYDNDRVLTQLTTPEALTNAESYGLLVQQLATNRIPSMPMPRDTQQDCPREWWPAIQRALARAQRANRNAQTGTTHLTPAAAANWPAQQIQYLGGATQAAIDAAHSVYDRAERRLQSPISFECEPGGGGRCDSSLTYWYALGDLHVCPSWMALGSEEERIVTLLAGLYGYLGYVDDDARRTGYARLAVTLTTQSRPVPTLGDVLGNPAWSADHLRIQVQLLRPVPPGFPYYNESGFSHDRLVRDFPTYQNPNCGEDSLPFRAEILFVLDEAGNGRPTPFTPPRVSIERRFVAPTGSFNETWSDTRPAYTRPGGALSTSFPAEFRHPLAGNGTFILRAQMVDPDSGVTRLFDDTIPVTAVVPCPPPPPLMPP